MQRWCSIYCRASFSIIFVQSQLTTTNLNQLVTFSTEPTGLLLIL
jgi:hypothetical protein